MKISYNWLKDYVDIGNIDPQELATILTDTGLEVEGLEKFESVKGGLEGILIGEVLTCEKHPNADKLSLTTVNIGGDTPLSIVCGAPNVAAGQKVLVATIGTTLTMNDQSLTIKKTKIRGEKSEGMICAEDEIGLGSSHDGIMVLDSTSPIGKPAREHFDIEEDWVFEIGLTPNRTDATSHIGVARDIVAALNQQHDAGLMLKRPDVDDFQVGNRSRKIDIQILDKEACPRYTGLTMTGIEVKESPAWLKNRLNAIGIRPINNIVDITNYILMETGQPLHAFDANKIKDDKVVIRKANKAEPFITLDEIKRELLETDLMICNAADPMCIAGVFGGIESGVTESSKDVFLESAYFDPGSIRKTSKHHGLQTDASFRFERGADPNITVYAIKRAASLIKELANGNIASDIVDVYPNEIKGWTVNLNYNNLDVLVGKHIEPGIIKSILANLEIEISEENAEGLTAIVPNYRYDVRREADLIEEVLRIYGYNNVEFGDKVNASLSFYPKPDRDKLVNIVAELLNSNGFSEIMNNSLTRSGYAEKVPGFHVKNNVLIFNPLSIDLDAMRQTLLFGGLESVQYNQNRQSNDQKMFEFGTTYKLYTEKASPEKPLKKYFESMHLGILISGRKNPESWNTDSGQADFFYLKSMVQQILKRIGLDLDSLESQNGGPEYFESALVYIKDNKPLIEIGKLSKVVLDQFDIKQNVFYADLHWDNLFRMIKVDDKQYVPVSKYPEVRRDLALLVDKSVSFGQIKELVYKSEKRLIRSVNLFDVYEGDKLEAGKKSYAISIIIKDYEKTLTDKIVDKIIKKTINLLVTELGASIR